MAKFRPSLRETETYTETNFLRLHTSGRGRSSALRVTLEHLHYHPPRAESDRRGWRCETIVDGEAMTLEDAVFIAKAYAEENAIPVIYESHSDASE